MADHLPSEFNMDHEGGILFDAEDQAWLKSFLPDNAVPTGYFGVACWIDPETGTQHWRKVCCAEVPVSQILGFIEMGKMQLMSECDLNVGLEKPSYDDPC